MASVEKVSEAITEMPDSIRRSVRAGFRIADSLAPEIRQQFLVYFAETMSAGGASVNIEALAKATNTEVSRAGPVLTAVSVLVGLLTNGELSADEFVAEARGKLFDEVYEPTVKSLAVAVAESAAEWKRTLESDS